MLNNERILITGSSQGIGLAAARACLHADARVVLTSQLPLEQADDVQAILNTFPESRYLVADLRDDATIVPLVEQAWNVWDGIDILINNVGTFREPSFLNLQRADFDATYHLNVWSAIAVTQAFVRRNIERKRGGRILFSSSLNGSRSEPGHTLYDASKGAIDALTRQLAIELAPLGFTTAGIAPGLIETPLTDFGLRSDPAARAEVESQIPLRRIGTVDDVAQWYVFLASRASWYATGVTIPVDGGLNAQQMPSRPITHWERG